MGTLAGHWGVVARRLPAAFRPLLAVHVAYTLLGLAILTPLVGLVVRTLLGLGGNAAVADQDIAWFLLSPLGMASLVLVAGLLIAIVAVEQAAMMGIAAASADGARPGWRAALRFAAWLLITDHDINFYLSARPPQFIATLAIAGVLGLVMAVILLSRLADWSLALPLVLFAGVSPRDSFAESGGLWPKFGRPAYGGFHRHRHDVRGPCG